MEYHVIWKIDIEAESFEDAARIAREIQRDPDSLATQFLVESESGETEEVWADEKKKDKHTRNVLRAIDLGKGDS